MPAFFAKYETRPCSELAHCPKKTHKKFSVIFFCIFNSKQFDVNFIPQGNGFITIILKSIKKNFTSEITLKNLSVDQVLIHSCRIYLSQKDQFQNVIQAYNFEIAACYQPFNVNLSATVVNRIINHDIVVGDINYAELDYTPYIGYGTRYDFKMLDSSERYAKIKKIMHKNGKHIEFSGPVEESKIFSWLFFLTFFSLTKIFQFAKVMLSIFTVQLIQSE